VIIFFLFPPLELLPSRSSCRFRRSSDMTHPYITAIL
jgi:hypothetical protein